MSLDYKGPKSKLHGFANPNRIDVSYSGIDPQTGEIMASMTKQSEMEACDIHNVLRQYSDAGLRQLITENQARGQYADLPDDLDYQNALNTIIAGNVAFASLPSATRERFHNNPAEFLEFFSNPENQDEAIKLGLATDNRPPAPADPSTGDVVLKD